MASKSTRRPRQKPAVVSDTVAETRAAALAAEKVVKIPWQARMRAKEYRRQKPIVQPYQLPDFPDTVKPESSLAQDEALTANISWAAGQIINSTYAEGVQFLGYALLSALAQRAEYRVVTECIASEMTREWIILESTGTDKKIERVKLLSDAIERFKLRDAFRKASESDGFFGRGHIYIDTGDTDDRDELVTPIGDGREAISKEKVGVKKVKAFRPVEAVWSYPTQYNSTDPMKEDWYKPSQWFVMNKPIHSSRFLTLVGREVPDMLKPAYAFGGLSMSQMIKPYVDNWLRTRQSVADLIASFSVSGIKTNLIESLNAGGDVLFERAEIFNQMRDNNGLMMLDKASEEFFNVSTPLGGLDALQAQTQEHMAAIARIPLVKLLGIQPAGLNASSEGELRSFYDWIHAFQEFLFRIPLTICLNFIQLSEFGNVDSEIGFKFKDLWQLDEAGKMAIEKQKTDIDDANIASGIISPQEGRERLAGDPESIYHGLDLDKGVAPGEQAEGEEGAEGFEDPEGLGGEEGEEDNDNIPGNNFKPKDPANRLSSSIISKSANFGGAGSGDFAFDEKTHIHVYLANDAVKLPKSKVDFEHPAQKDNYCDECVHFDAPNGCYLVEGLIRQNDWCKLWEEDETTDDAGFEESKHPRGQPDNPGQFGPGGGGQHIKSNKEGVDPEELYDQAVKSITPSENNSWKKIVAENPKLSREEGYALGSYSGSGDEDPESPNNNTINGYLRNGKVRPEYLELVDNDKDQAVSDIENTIKDLDSALAKASLSETIVAYRGVPKSILSKLKVGGVLSDKGYSSTSLNKNMASYFAEKSNSGGAIVRIEIPKGSPALANDQSGQSELEIVLKRDARFKVVSGGGKEGWLLRYEGGSPKANDAEFHEADHPRGQPDNPGQFGPGGGGGSKSTKAEPKRSSNAQAHLVSEPDKSKWPAHIKKMKIPPAWTDVKISPDPKAALQAVGKDAKGRGQYVYSEKFRESQSAKKFSRIKQLANKFGVLLTQNEKGLASKDNVIREHAVVTSLIMDMGLRPGSDKETGAEKKAYGATTLQSDHVFVDDDGNVSLQFVGKKGVDINLPVTNEQLASQLKARKQQGGSLFPEVTDSTLRKYVAKLGGGGFKTKDLRTLKGTTLANSLVANVPAPKTQAEYKKAVRQVAEAVSKKLGNTPIVCLQSYISPVVFASWQENI